MLALIFALLFIFIVSLGLGLAFSRFVGLAVPQKVLETGFTETFFVGLCIWGILLQVWSLFLPVDEWASALSLLIGLGGAWQGRSVLCGIAVKAWGFTQNSRQASIFFLIFAICLLIAGLIPPINYDSGLYHIQAIRWIEKYGVLPGLGNVHGRFAFNPATFVLSAGSTFHQCWGASIYAVNVAATGVFGAYLLHRIVQTVSWAKLAFYAILFFLFLKSFVLQVSSPTPDILAALLPCYVLLWVLERELGLVKPIFEEYFSIIWIIFFAFTVKLNTAPTGLLLVYLLYQYRSTISLRYLVLVFAMGLSAAFPWLLRNIYLSGYLVYPIASTQLGNLDWAIPLENVIDERNWIYSWARLPGRDWHEVLPLSFAQWFGQWFVALHIVYKASFILALLSPIIMSLLFVYYRKKSIFALSLLAVWLVAWGGFCFWFYTAPDFRFGGAFIWLTCLLPLWWFSGKQNQFYLHQMRSVMLFALSLSMLYYGQNAARRLTGYEWSEYALVPLRIEAKHKNGFVKFDTQKVNGLPVLVPSGDNRCFDTSLICTPCFNPTLMLRGKDIKEGFKVRQARPMTLQDF